MTATKDIHHTVRIKATPSAAGSPPFTLMVSRWGRPGWAAFSPTADQAKPVADKDIQTPKAVKPKRRHESTEARVIYELHRHGIYW